MRILSGIQPSGRLHVGNYFGAIRQHVQLQDAGHQCFYFIANYHALTTVQGPAELAASTLHVAMAYLSLGIDPARSVFFAQSDVPQVAELCWILNCVCPVALMEKGTSYKDKIAKGLPANMGLLDYPVLQAADIVIYDAELVPVGADQKQHVEMTRDIAGKFNTIFGPIPFQDFADAKAAGVAKPKIYPLVLPQPHIVPEVAVVPGIDGQKMSKSYNNAVEIFATDKQTAKRCAQIVTDSTPLEAPKDPEKDNVYALLKLFCQPTEADEIAASYRAGGYGYGQAKKRLAELINERFAPARRRYEELEKTPDTVRDILREGGRKAREVAEKTMSRVRAACGLARH